MKRQKIFGMAFLMALVLLFVPSMRAQAAEANAHFGSPGYNKIQGELFNIGLYLESEEAFGDYSITMTYDANIIEYVSGATEGGDGSIRLSGTANGGYVKVLVRFRALAVGDTTLTISEATALGNEGEAFTIVNQGSVPLSVRSDDPVYLSGITINGEEIGDFDPENFGYSIVVPYETESLEVGAVGNDAVISDSNLAVGENTISLTLTSRGGAQTVYLLHVIRQEQVAEPVVEPEYPDETVQPEQEQTEIVIPTLDYGEEGSVRGLFSSIFTQKIVLIPVLIVIILVVGVSGLITYLEYAREYEREQRRNKAAQKIQDLDVENLDEESAEECVEETANTREEFDGNYDERLNAGYDVDIDGEPLEASEEEEKAVQPVIVVDDVCMDFKVAMQNVSGVKEWLIEKIKGKISYRTLHALDHVSFEVYPGEVVGIIGTNGSGKSTLLKIVSGVMSPTSGRVIADRSKIQLLTLGTGFDMELTARENVYLNGAIIGYSREFIDEHYDEIVAFAELEDFMEEKVKNFSSGMVSRLGFAIATAGDAAEILILDEVLSVGDEFFRKKSLARIQEMIHGGSTVLMVSHGIETIKSNCSIAVWIEKGELRMIGDVNEVCDAYRKMGQGE